MYEPSRVFIISHNYADRHHVPPLLERITGLRMSAYVDWLHDIHLDRDHVDRGTAELLRQRLQQVHCLIFLVSLAPPNRNGCLGSSDFSMELWVASVFGRSQIRR